MNKELAIKLAKVDAEMINKFYQKEEIQGALTMTRICIATFIPLIDIGEGNLIKANVFYRQYIITLLAELINEEYATRSIVLGNYDE